jgi:hypothetical protein
MSLRPKHSLGLWRLCLSGMEWIVVNKQFDKVGLCVMQQAELITWRPCITMALLGWTEIRTESV